MVLALSILILCQSSVTTSPQSKFYQNQSPVKVLSQPTPSPSSVKINLPSKFCCILMHLSKFCPNVKVLSDKLKCFKILHLQPHLNPNVDHLQKFSWEISETFTHKLIRNVGNLMLHCSIRLFGRVQFIVFKTK